MRYTDLTTMPAEYVIYSTPTCRYCTKAKDLLLGLGKDYEERDAREPEHNAFLKASGLTTVPQIYRRIPENREPDHIGGFEDLKSYFGIE